MGSDMEHRAHTLFVTQRRILLAAFVLIAVIWSLNIALKATEYYEGSRLKYRVRDVGNMFERETKNIKLYIGAMMLDKSTPIWLSPDSYAIGKTLYVCHSEEERKTGTCRITPYVPNDKAHCGVPGKLPCSPEGIFVDKFHVLTKDEERKMRLENQLEADEMHLRSMEADGLTQHPIYIKMKKQHDEQLKELKALETKAKRK